MRKDKRKNEIFKGIDPEDVINDLMRSKDILIRNYILSNCVSVNVPLKNFMGEFEREMICRALRVSGGNQRIASFILGLKPSTLNEKIKKFKIIEEIRKFKDEKDLKYILESRNILLLYKGE